TDEGERGCRPEGEREARQDGHDHQSREDHQAPQAHHDRQGHADRFDRLHARVLVAEERPVASCSATAVLRAAGADVAAVTSGAQAAQALPQCRPDLVVTEARWPAGSGFAVLEASRRLCPTTPVILFAAQPTIGEAVRAIEEGADN